MVFDLEQLTQAALALPSDAKVTLVERLLQSLDAAGLSEIDEAWIEEAEKRYEELHSGKIVGIPANEVFAQIREELG